MAPRCDGEHVPAKVGLDVGQHADAAVVQHDVGNAGHAAVLADPSRFWISGGVATVEGLHSPPGRFARAPVAPHWAVPSTDDEVESHCVGAVARACATVPVQTQRQAQRCCASVCGSESPRIGRLALSFQRGTLQPRSLESAVACGRGGLSFCLRLTGWLGLLRRIGRGRRGGGGGRRARRMGRGWGLL